MPIELESRAASRYCMMHCTLQGNSKDDDVIALYPADAQHDVGWKRG